MKFHLLRKRNAEVFYENTLKTHGFIAYDLGSIIDII